MNLVADIGGTSSRFALTEPGGAALIEQRKYRNAEFGSLEQAIRHYLSEAKTRAGKACIAIAGPVVADEVRLTNLNWTFSQATLQKNLGLKRLHITNDFTALAMGVPQLTPDAMIKLGPGAAEPNMAIAVLGPGTGLGVSGILWSGTHWVPIAGEGGNVQFAPGDDWERSMMQIAQHRLGGFVAIEEFLSGRGIVFLYRMVSEIQGKQAENLPPDEITRRAVKGECAQCVETVQRFCGMLGGFAGDVALLLGARGGVYIGGGISPQLEHMFPTSSFRERFEAKGRFKDYLSRIPTYMLLSHSKTALLGAAIILNEEGA